MTKEEFNNHSFEQDEVVLLRGKPVHVISASPHSLTVRIGRNSFKTVLPVEVELIDACGDVEFR